MKPREAHGKPLPHGVSCAQCLAERRCNQCGVAVDKWKRCTNGRCRNCCDKCCRHTTQ